MFAWDAPAPTPGTRTGTTVTSKPTQLATATPTSPVSSSMPATDHVARADAAVRPSIAETIPTMRSTLKVMNILRERSNG